MHAKFNEVLIETHRSGKRFLLLLDEAHNFDERTMESIRLLSDFETPKKKLVQIIFSGQPALDELLTRPAMVQVRQRISLFRRLEPLSREEVSEYITHRLNIVGVTQELFSPSSLEVIADLTGGIPREIHNVCFAALSLASTRGQARVDCGIVYDVARDLRISLCDQLYEEDAISEGPPVAGQHDEPRQARAAAAVSSGPATLSTPTTTADVEAVEVKDDTSAEERRFTFHPAEVSEQSITPKGTHDVLFRRTRRTSRWKRIAVTAAACAILSGYAVYAWIEGVNGKNNSLVSAQTFSDIASTEPAKPPVVAAKPRPPTKRREIPQIVSDRSNSHIESTANTADEIQAFASDTNPPIDTAAAEVRTRANTNELIAAAVMPSTITPVAPAPALVSKFVPSRLIDSPRPTYPPAARNAGIWGEVELEAIIATDGKLRDIRVVKGHPLLNSAAIKAAEQQQYSPYLLNGVPKEVSTRVRFVFKLP
jgi:TonB family protein